MGRTKACEECSTKCLLVHGQRDPSPVITSFFKVILGDSVSKALAIPPSFAKTIASLANKRTFLEDSSGQRWKVKICSIGGKLVFQQGWHEFTSDHSVESGDFMVFYYINGSHFVVQIYGRSGCEKLHISKRINSRVNKTSLDRLPSDGTISTSPESPSTMIDKSLENEQGSCSTTHFDSDAELIQSDGNIQDVQTVPLPTVKTYHCSKPDARSTAVLSKNLNEVPFYMIDRGLVTEPGENRSSLFDLSHFETPKSKSGVSEMNSAPVSSKKKMYTHSDTNTVKPQTTRKTNCVEHQCKTIHEELEGSKGAPTDKSDFKIPTKSCNVEDTYKVPFTRDKFSTCRHTPPQLQIKSTGDFGENVKGNGDNSEGVFRKYLIPEHWIRVYSDLPEKDPVLQLELLENITPLGHNESVNNFVEEMSGGNKGLTMKGKGKRLKVAKEEPGEKVKEHGLDFGMPKKNCSTEDTYSVPFIRDKISTRSTTLKQSTMDFSENATGIGNKSKGALGKYPFPEKRNGLSKKEPVFQMEGIGLSSCQRRLSGGKEPKNVKSEYEENLKCVEVKRQCREVVKTENVESSDLPSSSLANLHCSVSRDPEFFLELPICFPSFFGSGKRKTERKIVLLRDPSMKVWPVLYHERAGFRVLTSGWEALTKANNIEKGDMCAFEVENEQECLFRIRIDKK